MLIEKEIDKIYLGNDEIQAVYLGDDLIWGGLGNKYTVDFLLVGGGGSGGSGLNSTQKSSNAQGYGGGGGGGGFLELCCVDVTGCCFPVTIGQGGTPPDHCTAVSGGDTCFEGYVAYGGGAGATAVLHNGCDGGSGGGGAYARDNCYTGTCCKAPGNGIAGQGYEGGLSGACSNCCFGGAGGGGGAGGPGCSYTGTGNGGAGGPGKCSCMSGVCYWYSGGGGGAASGTGGTGGGGNGGGGKNAGCPGTYYGGGGGGGQQSNCSLSAMGAGHQGVAIIRYPTACGYTLYGGSKYQCGDYTIHCFTKTGILDATGMHIGVFHNQSLGLITLSSDGYNWITIADKNLGATQVWNFGDTVTGANAGCYYQWGNNYGFPFTGAVNVSCWQTNASSYGPGNYFCCDVFSTHRCWDTSNNANLWGGQTGTVEAMQGPTPSGYHVQSMSELTNIRNVMNDLGGNECWDCFSKYLHIPRAGDLWFQTGVRCDSGIGEYWLTCSIGAEGKTMMYSNTSNYYTNGIATQGLSIRPFLNTGCVPDSTWCKLL